MKQILILVLFIAVNANTFSQTKGSECEVLVNKGIESYKKQQFASAVELFEKALKSCSRDTGMADYEYYLLLAFTSISYYEIGREDSALITGEAAAKFFEQLPKNEEPVYYTMIGRLGFCYMNYSEFYNAVRALEIASSHYEKKSGPSSETYIAYASELANAYAALGFYEKSMQLNRKLKGIVLSTKGKENAFYITILTNMGNDFTQLGLYDSARIYQQESLELRGRVLGKNHHEYAKGLSNLAVLYVSQKRFPDAIFLYEAAKDIYEKNKSNKSLEYAALLTNLGDCYCSLDQYLRGTEMMVQGLQITEEKIGRYNTRFAVGVQKVAAAYVDAGGEQNITDAIGFYKIAIGIMNKIWADSTMQYASLLSGIGNAYSHTKKLDSALYFLKRSEVLLKALKLDKTENFAVLLGHEASVYKQLKDYSSAINKYATALTLIKSIYGDNYPALSTMLSNLSLIYFDKGDYVSADSLFRQTFSLDKAYILQNTEGLSEEEKESLAVSIKATATWASGIRLDKGIKLKNDWLVNSSLFYKGLLLEGSKEMTKAFKSFKDTSLKRKAQEYLYLKAYVGSQQLKPLQSRDASLKEVENKVIDLERALLKGSAEYRTWKDQFNISLQDIQNKLGSDELAIEFITYYGIKDGYADRDNARYAALLIKKNKEPEIVHLFSDVELNKLLSKTSSEAMVKKLYRSTIKSSAAQPTASDSLYHFIWKPLVPYVKNVKRIYFAADGVINNLNLAAIITPEGKRLIEDYEFVQLSSTRNLLKNNTSVTFNNIQFWGGVNYGHSKIAGVPATFTYLPGTLTEVNDIVAILNNSRKVSVNTGNAANESNFKLLNGNAPEVIHIATHGFFFPDPNTTSKAESNKYAKASNPLLRSGLALAEANVNWNETLVSSDKQDGVLTAYEIADMDLSNTKLVVLSACETGLGDIKSGEGVYGLQRAFKLAGVDYLIMSLWQVPDLETKEFMKTFYEKCFAGKPIRTAFRETQLIMNKKYQPYQWAAFVLVE